MFRYVAGLISKFLLWVTPSEFSLFRLEWSDVVVGNLRYVHVGYLHHSWLGRHRKVYELIEPYISIDRGGVDNFMEAEVAVAGGRDGLFDAFPIDSDVMEVELSCQRARGNLKV